MGTLLKYLTERDVEFLEEFDLTDIFKRENRRHEKCFEWIKIHFEQYFNHKTGQIDYYSTPEMHCMDCDKNALTRNALAIFMALKLKNYLIDNIPFYIDHDKYFLNSNQLVFKKVDETSSFIKMKKIERKPRTVDKDSLESWHGRLISEEFPSDILQINDNTCFVLTTNGNIVDIEQFPYNIKRIAKLYLHKGKDPIKRSRNCDSKVKMLTSLFAANIDYNTHYFFNDNYEQYTELIPLQIELWFLQENQNFKGGYKEKFDFLNQIDHIKFGTGAVTRRILYIWLSSKIFELTKDNMLQAMIYIREHLNFDIMHECMAYETKTTTMIKSMLQNYNLMPAGFTLNQFLDAFEGQLNTIAYYIKYTPHHCKFKTVGI